MKTVNFLILYFLQNLLLPSKTIPRLLVFGDCKSYNGKIASGTPTSHRSAADTDLIELGFVHRVGRLHERTAKGEAKD